ncbi:MAG: hypothetical protein ACFWTZ_07155 [Burkholderia sp.]|jgi:hypothetical protein
MDEEFACILALAAVAAFALAWLWQKRRTQGPRRVKPPRGEARRVERIGRAPARLMPELPPEPPEPVRPKEFFGPGRPVLFEGLSAAGEPLFLIQRALAEGGETWRSVPLPAEAAGQLSAVFSRAPALAHEPDDGLSGTDYFVRVVSDGSCERLAALDAKGAAMGEPCRAAAPSGAAASLMEPSLRAHPLEEEIARAAERLEALSRPEAAASARALAKRLASDPKGVLADAEQKLAALPPGKKSEADAWERLSLLLLALCAGADHLALQRALSALRREASGAAFESAIKAPLDAAELSLIRRGAPLETAVRLGKDGRPAELLWRGGF